MVEMKLYAYMKMLIKKKSFEKKSNFWK